MSQSTASSRAKKSLSSNRGAVTSNLRKKTSNPTGRQSARSPWLTNLPDDWTVVPLAWIARFAGGGTPSKEILDYWDGDTPWVSPKDMKGELVIDSEDHLTHAGVAASLPP